MAGVSTIISGGQTGADQGGLHAALALGLEHGGWIPRGRKTEDGPLPPQFHLQETDSTNYAERTEKNILAADATIIISRGPLTNGSDLTRRLAKRHAKPCLHVDLDLLARLEAVSMVRDWLEDHRVSTLNVAGPRASKDHHIQQLVCALLIEVLSG